VKRCDFPLTLAVIALAIAATCLAFASPAIRDALIADGRIADGQVWRLVTGPFVHATWGHLVRDLALVALAGIAYEAPLRSRALFAVGLVAPCAAVLLAGDASWYCGTSGLSHALLAAALAFEALRRRGRARVFVLALCAIAIVKPLYELVTGGPAFAMSLGDGVKQVPLAHVIGVLVGIAFGVSRAAAAHDARMHAVAEVDLPRKDRELLGAARLVGLCLGHGGGAGALLGRRHHGNP
jgi:rhomboid family GlyGly-CTERM serine protease